MTSKPGVCYPKCLIQDQYETVTEQVLTQDEQPDLRIITAAFETIPKLSLRPDQSRQRLIQK
jgi:hypothetical protein